VSLHPLGGAKHKTTSFLIHAGRFTYLRSFFDSRICAVLCSAPPNGCRDTHPTWRTKEERLFNGDQVAGRQRPAHHQGYCSDVFGCMMPHRLVCNFVADLIACRLIFS